MRCDFHVHTRASHDCAMIPERIVDAAVRRGLDAIAICDHGTIAGVDEVREAAARRGAGLLVVPGIEVRSAEGELIGLFVSEAVQGGMSAADTVRALKSQGAVVVVPHPFDRFRTSAIQPDALEDIVSSLDAVEGLNARNLRAEDDRRAQEWARARGLSCIAGSDAHSYKEIGRAWTRLPEFRDAATLRDALAEAEPRGGRSSVFVHVPTAFRKRWRRSVERLSVRGQAR